MWTQLEAMAARAPTMADLFHHRLGGIEARRLRALGHPLPAALAEEEQYASFSGLAAPVVLSRIADICEQPVLILKGSVVASLYPDAAMRPSLDVDVLVPDAAAAHAALLREACVVVDETHSPHHELPLIFPDLPLVIELHSTPKWPAWGAPPATAELLSRAAPFDDGPALAPAPADHAVLLAAHAWAHRPLTKVLDLVDVLVLDAEAAPGASLELARRWGVARLWQATVDAAHAIFAGAPRPWTLRTWGRNTLEVRRPHRREELFERMTSPFAVLP